MRREDNVTPSGLERTRPDPRAGRRAPAHAHGRASHRQPRDAPARMGDARRLVGVVGRLLLLQRRCGEGASALHHRVLAGRDRGDHPQRRHPPDGPIPAERQARLGPVFRHGASQQRRAVHALRLGPDPYRERPRFDPERHDASVHRGRGACLHLRREDDGQSPPRRAPRHCRGHGDDRAAGARRTWCQHARRIRLPRRGAHLCVRRRLRAAIQAYGRSRR